MYTLPTVKRFRKRSRIQNLTMQLSAFQRITGVLSKILKVQHNGLVNLRENYLEAPLDRPLEGDGMGYVWNGDKPAPEMILDIAEQVEAVFKEAGVDPS